MLAPCIRTCTDPLDCVMGCGLGALQAIHGLHAASLWHAEYSARHAISWTEYFVDAIARVSFSVQASTYTDILGYKRLAASGLNRREVR